MQLDKVAVVLRPRLGWEAVDLGFRMAAHWKGAVWAVWFCIFAPLALVLSVAFADRPWLAGLVLWWLKPVYDRWVLHVLSRAVFGDVPTLAQTLAAWRDVLSPALPWSLVSRLWDVTRSFTLPVTQLERQRGKPARLRRKLLRQRVGGNAFGLTLVCGAFEVVVIYGLYSFGLLFATDVQVGHPANPFEFENLLDVEHWWTWRDTLVYALAISLIEPFYVAGGFGLYLNRRVLLEGWDVEVALRRMTQRFMAQATRLAALLLVGVLGAAAFAPLPAHAAAPAFAATSTLADTKTPAAPDDEDDTETTDDDDAPVGPPQAYTPADTPARRAAQEIVGDPAFGSERKERRWRWIDRGQQPEPKKRERTAGSDVLNVIGELLRVIAWVALAVFLVALAWFLARQWQGRAPAVAAAAPPTQLFGLAISPESLPPDVPSAARALLARGQVREALSLLYRGALSHLVHDQGVVVRRGATEGDVLTLARRSLPQASAGYFERLLPAWIEAAYAARLPGAEAVAALCDLHAASLPRRAADEAAA